MFSPVVNDIVKQELEKEAHELEKKIADIKITLQREPHRNTNDISSKAQWTNSYKRWNDYQDTDELQSKFESAEIQLTNLKERIDKLNDSNVKSCNHRFACGCSGNKEAERQVVSMATSKRLKEMLSFKEEGNILFKEKNYRDALALYEKSLIYFEYCFDGNEAEQKMADALRLSCLLNAGK